MSTSSSEAPRHAAVAIIGAGLAGLCVARGLHAAGVDYAVLEGRERLGGRILSVDDTGTPSRDGFDLGPSWFWPHTQPEMAALVQALGLTSMPQHSDGDVLFERMSRENPWRCRATGQTPQSMRLVGGTGALITALAEPLPRQRLLRNTPVTQLVLAESGVTVMTAAEGGRRTVVAQQVVAAIPPRVLAALTFSPGVPAAAMHRWQDTATWMAPHAKFLAVYDRAFWYEAGLCGTAQSLVGPMSEIHDATTASGTPALFGFLGVDAEARAASGESALTAACLAQLGRLFGPAALAPRSTRLKDWAADPFTATARDRRATGHPQPAAAPWIEGAWAERLSLCGSETSAVEPGYMEGAVSAAHHTAREVLQRLR